MKTVCITDGVYRSALAAARMFSRAGCRVVVTQTRAESKASPPVFFSRCAEGRWLEGSVRDDAYPDRLAALLQGLAEETGTRPILFCVGAGTLNVVAANRARFAALADYLIAPPEVLDALNDKERVHARCLELQIPVPRSYKPGETPAFPLIVKPRCGEKAGLKAKDRYKVVQNEAELHSALDALRKYDPEPIIQEKVSGDGFGASLLLGPDSELIDGICHRRIREYPDAGGPSTCCVSVYDETKLRRAHALLKSFGFVGLAMVEFKGDRVLEVNPRIWGSFPLTAICGSQLCAEYARAAAAPAAPAPVGAHTRAPATSAPAGTRACLYGGNVPQSCHSERSAAEPKNPFSPCVGAHTVRPQGESVSDKTQPTDSAPIHPTAPAPWAHDMRPDETVSPAAPVPVGAHTRAPAASASVGAHTVRPQGESVSDQPQPADSAPIHPTAPAPWAHDMRPDETVSPAASAPVEAHILPPESETPPILCGPTYRTGVKLRFFFNDLAAGADLLRHGKLGRAGSALLDAFRVREALNDREDRKAYRKYLRSYLPGRRGK